MAWSGFSSASSWRAAMVVGTAVALCIGSSTGIRATGQEQPKDDLKLSLDAPAILLFKIKPDRVADFEALVAGICSGLAKSTKEDVKAFAASYHPFKVETAPGLYVFYLEKPSKTISYNPVALLYYTDTEAIKREEADALFPKWKDAAESINILPLKPMS
jgi:hypothetical protein